ncbi:hypothetical protein [uncultured Tateyamaria sp.]|uniref:hypothetical protein n=1 Tax=uncultured Tateyamaria sp. TaxID=455651 RepID=UPI002614EE52|nr:hypothetical protein [uncultured Tateyamaria sp.]
MAITVNQLLEDGATVQVRCLGCGTITQLSGKRLAAHCDLSLDVRALQLRSACRRCAWPGEVLVLFPCENNERRADEFRLPSGP